jgi:DNA-binding GntR family transcriptional regulator
VFDVQKLDPDDPRPQYVQLVEAIRQDVDAGVLSPGERLPSHAEVASSYGVSVGTVKRAFAVLQDDGVIVSRQGQPAHVRARRDSDAPSRGSSLPDDVRAALADLDRRLSAVERRLSQVSP